MSQATQATSCCSGILQYYEKYSACREVKFVRSDKEDPKSIQALVYTLTSTGSRQQVGTLSGDRVKVIKESGYEALRDFTEGVSASGSQSLIALSCKEQDALLSIPGLQLTADSDAEGRLKNLVICRKS